MRILFVAPRFHTNQVEAIRALVAAGHKVWFHAATIGAVEDHGIVVPHVHPQAIASCLLTRLLGFGANNSWYCPAPLSYWREFRRVAPDVAVVRWHNLLFCWLVGLYARLCGCRVVIYEQITPDLLATVWSRGLMGRLRKARFGLRTQLLKAAWMTPLPGTAPLPADGFFVPFAVPMAASFRQPASIPRLLEIGKFVPNKNHLVFVAAVAEVARDAAVSATIVGECSTAAHRDTLDGVRRAIDNRGLQNVEIRCNVPHAAMEAIYGNHDVFVLASTAEPGAFSPLEALGQGLPVVVTDECGTKGYIDEGITGVVCQARDVTALADAIRQAMRLSREPASPERIADIARRRFSADAFLSAFGEMLSRRFGIQIESGREAGVGLATTPAQGTSA
jgi:glycosyltransferase involved in cell wall biosynthesis